MPVPAVKFCWRLSSDEPFSFLVGSNTTLNAPAGNNFGPKISH
jgi:hypothetical protein